MCLVIYERCKSDINESHVEHEWAMDLMYGPVIDVIYERVTYHIWMRHRCYVRMNESHTHTHTDTTYEWVMPRVTETSDVWVINTSTYKRVTCHTYECIMDVTFKRVTEVVTNKWVMSRVNETHNVQMSQKCHILMLHMSHTNESYILRIHESQMWHTNES